MLAGYACSWPGLWTLPLAMESPLNMAHAGASPQPELPRVHGSALFESSPDFPISPVRASRRSAATRTRSVSQKWARRPSPRGWTCTRGECSVRLVSSLRGDDPSAAGWVGRHAGVKWRQRLHPHKAPTAPYSRPPASHPWARAQGAGVGRGPPARVRQYDGHEAEQGQQVHGGARTSLPSHLMFGYSRRPLACVCQACWQATAIPLPARFKPRSQCRAARVDGWLRDCTRATSSPRCTGKRPRAHD